MTARRSPLTRQARRIANIRRIAYLSRAWNLELPRQNTRPAEDVEPD